MKRTAIEMEILCNIMSLLSLDQFSIFAMQTSDPKH